MTSPMGRRPADAEIVSAACIDSVGPSRRRRLGSLEFRRAQRSCPKDFGADVVGADSSPPGLGDKSCVVGVPGDSWLSRESASSGTSALDLESIQMGVLPFFG